MNDILLEQIISDIENKNYNSAIENCNILISKYPENYKLFEIRSSCYSAIGSYDSAIEDLTNAINRTNILAENNNDLLELFLKRAKIYAKKQEWELAANDFKNVLSINDNMPYVHNSLSICYKKIEKYDDALFHSSKAIIFSENYAEAYNNRANIYVCLDKYENAIEDYTKSISLNPNSAKTFFNRGNIYYEVFKDKENSFSDFISAINLNPDYESEIYSFYPELDGELFKTGSDDVTIQSAGIINETESDIDSLLSKLTEAETKDSTFEQQINKTDEEILNPDIDFKSIFNEQESVDDLKIIEEQNESTVTPVISDDLRMLHDEITSEQNTVVSDTGIDEPQFSGAIFPTEDKPIVDTTSNKPAYGYFPESEDTKKSFLRAPVFFVILIGLMIIIIILSVLKFNKSDETIVVNNDVTSNVGKNDSVAKDTSNKEVKSDTISEINKVEEVKKETEEKTVEVEKKETDIKEQVLESKNLGYISDKKQFVLFSEPDGYYVQIGSYKEKSKAEEKLKLLKTNNIQGKVTEADLKEKGIFYRVRAGVFKTPEEAKEITVKIE